MYCPKCAGTVIEVQTDGFRRYNKAWCSCGWAGMESDLLPAAPTKPVAAAAGGVVSLTAFKRADGPVEMLSFDLTVDAGVQAPPLAGAKPDYEALYDSLLPCPFCGGRSLRLFDIAYDSHAIECQDCGAAGPPGKGRRPAAFPAWNRRVSS